MVGLAGGGVSFCSPATPMGLLPPRAQPRDNGCKNNPKTNEPSAGCHRRGYLLDGFAGNVALDPTGGRRGRRKLMPYHNVGMARRQQFCRPFAPR